MSSWEESYLGQLRKVVGSRRLLVPSARAFILDKQGRILFIRRRDNQSWAIPGGSMELDETVFNALQREVNEETGLEVKSASLIAIYSGQPVARRDQWGNEYQWLVLHFRVDEWNGSLAKETEETIDAEFFSIENLPEPMHNFEREAIEDMRRFSGQVILK